MFPLLRYMKDKSRASFLHSFVRIAFLFVLLLSLTDAIRVFRDVISVCRDFSNEASPPQSLFSLNTTPVCDSVFLSLLWSEATEENKFL